jgi:tRNA threonylcarbamoyladenosine biosynthesis protein TsaB
MLILAIDTSGRHGSVALCRGDANAFETLQMSALEGGTYSARLIPAISNILQQHNYTLAALGGFAIVSGPGSFTGLRVGLATVKGLCEIAQKPLAAVSMLEALAITYGADSRNVTAVLDAGRGEVYVGDYKLANARATMNREYILKLAAFAEQPQEMGELLTPDAAVADFLRERSFLVREVAPVKADGIARIGLRKLLAGEVADHATVDVNYIRRSDAEIFSPPKR